MSKATQDNIHNIADRLEASVRYGVITGGDDYERAIAEQQAVHAAKFIRELKAENARLREGLEKIADNTQIRNHPDGSEIILGHGSLEEISWDYIDDLHTIATHALNEREE